MYATTYLWFASDLGSPINPNASNGARLDLSCVLFLERKMSLAVFLVTLLISLVENRVDGGDTWVESESDDGNDMAKGPSTHYLKGKKRQKADPRNCLHVLY